MRVISDDGGLVRLACPACGSQRTIARFRSRRSNGRERVEPEEGQWLPCPVCQEWSPVEHDGILPGGVAGERRDRAALV